MPSKKKTSAERELEEKKLGASGSEFVEACQAAAPTSLKEILFWPLCLG
jgi:hypothetical protein